MTYPGRRGKKKVVTKTNKVNRAQLAAVCEWSEPDGILTPAGNGGPNEVILST